MGQRKKDEPLVVEAHGKEVVIRDKGVEVVDGGVPPEGMNQSYFKYLMGRPKEELCVDLINALCCVGLALKYPDNLLSFLVTTLETERYGKKRMRRALKQLSALVKHNMNETCDANQFLEDYGYHWSWRNGYPYLRDLEIPDEEFFGDMLSDASDLFVKLKEGKRLTEKEKEALRTLRGAGAEE